MSLELEGIENCGEFFSPHYLNAVLEGDLKDTFKRWKAAAARTPQDKLNGLADMFFTARAHADEAADPAARWGAFTDFNGYLLDALGHPRSPGLRAIEGGQVIPVLGAQDRDGHSFLWIIEVPPTPEGADPLDQPPLPEQFAIPEDATLAEDTWRALLDGPLFRTEPPPRWVLALCGPEVALIDRHKWGRGAHLRFDLSALFARRERKAFRALAGLLHKDVLNPADGSCLHDTLDENAHRHAFAVSTDLKRGATQAIELLANEAIHYLQTVSKAKVVTNDQLARQLSEECLVWLYRLLFLFYVEARGGELGVVPMGNDAYRLGYSLESLRDLEQVPLTTEAARNGYFINDSLNTLFRIVDLGHGTRKKDSLALDDSLADQAGFRVHGLRSGLFDVDRTPTLRPVRFRNFVLQQVLELLSLSKAGKKGRGRISYATLGINQLGAVYEGLLSYTGFFADEDLYAVRAATEAKKADARTFFVKQADLPLYTSKEIVADEHGRPVCFPKGSFMFRLASRDRETSASYYTPEVLTRCLTKYTLAERLKTVDSADEILSLTVCEPAMGSGAFLNEAVNQLAGAYLDRKQAELGQTLPSDEYLTELQRVKHHIAVHNCYGVDLNPLATELGKLSLWLNVLYAGARAPWFGARIKAGNSLVGARRAVYSVAQVTASRKKDRWFNFAPQDVPLLKEDGALPARPADSIYHFLLPDPGMSPFDKDKVVRELAPEGVAALKAWRKAAGEALTPMEAQALVGLSDEIDVLWRQHVENQEELYERTRQPVGLWGQPEPEKRPPVRIETGEEHTRALLEKGASPTRRLRAVMDLWCACWAWPVGRAGVLPGREQWAAVVAALLRGDVEAVAEGEEVVRVAVAVRERLRFFHWPLEFGADFAARGGFDVVLGNPPWLKLQWNEQAVLADIEPRLEVKRMSAKQAADLRAETLSTAEYRAGFLEAFEELNGVKAHLNAVQCYPLLQGVQTNLYKCFITQSLDVASRGAVGLLHQPGIWEDPKGGTLRASVAPRLGLVALCKNQLKLFEEVHHERPYAFTVWRGAASETQYRLVANLFHPRTLDESVGHDGKGPVPGIKDDDGNWDLRGHADRIVDVDESALALFARLYDAPGTPAGQARLPVVHSGAALSVLRKFSACERTLADLPEEFFCTEHFHETNQQKDGTIRRDTRYPADVHEWVVSGPHFYVGTPFNKTPNEGCHHNQDYTVVDLVEAPDDYLPRTNYLPACDPEEYARRTPQWRGELVTKRFRHLHRKMIAPTGERTLVPALIPPGPAHIMTTVSASFNDHRDLLRFNALCSSLVWDFFLKSTGKSDLTAGAVGLLRYPNVDKSASEALALRVLRLNCLTTHYAPLWAECFTPEMTEDTWTSDDPRLTRPALAPAFLTPTWSRHCALRTPYARRQALVELDALAALALGLTADELCTIYRVQFPVLRQYEADTWYDRRGMIVFTNNRGLSGVGLDRKTFEAIKDAQPGDAVPEPYQPPFDRCDREADMRRAYAAFEARLP